MINFSHQSFSALIIGTSQKPQDLQKKAEKILISNEIYENREIAEIDDIDNEIEKNEVENIKTEAKEIKENENIFNGDVEKELRVAKETLKKLEKRIEELELSVPKKYKPVKFQNYQNRKRILVSFVSQNVNV